jgi:hypothetical protein
MLRCFSRAANPNAGRFEFLPGLARIPRIRAEFRPGRPLAFELQRDTQLGAGFCRDDVGHHAGGFLGCRKANLQISGVPILKIDGRPRNCGSELHVNPGVTCTRAYALKSQAEDYRAKAKEYGRLTVVTKSLREGRRYRKLAEMYWALALGEESKSLRSSKMIVKPRSS